MLELSVTNLFCELVLKLKVLIKGLKPTKTAAMDSRKYHLLRKIHININMKLTINTKG